MRITKKQLRRIIREEKARLLRESEDLPAGMSPSPQNDLKMLDTVIKNLKEMAEGDVDEEMKDDLLSQVELLDGIYSSMYGKTIGR